MACNNAYYGEPQRYVYHLEPAFVRDGLPYDYYDTAMPVAFRQPPFYDDVHYHQDFRRHYPDLGHPWLIPREHVLVRRGGQSGGPWWLNPVFPHGGHDGHRIFVVERHPEHEHSEQTVEMYVPQLCCDNCVRRVTGYLNRHFHGVENVTADQWEKKVVVVGRNLQPYALLRGLQRNLGMPRSVFWADRSR